MNSESIYSAVDCMISLDLRLKNNYNNLKAGDK